MDELMVDGWPLSIDHTDLHTNNAAIRENGKLLIFDWEEATVSSPFFSIFRLLLEASKFEEGPHKQIQADGSLRLTSKQLAIRRAYIDSLPWKNHNQRARAFDVAMCLAPIRMAYYECVTIKAALNQKDIHPSVPARCFGVALQYWQAMAYEQNLST